MFVRFHETVTIKLPEMCVTAVLLRCTGIHAEPHPYTTLKHRRRLGMTKKTIEG